jgi:hypothetical protein
MTARCIEKAMPINNEESPACFNMNRSLCMLVGIGLVLFLPACGKPLYPRTMGSYRALPKQPAQVVVWGKDSPDEVITAVEAWLQKRGLIIAPRDKFYELSEERTRGTHSGDAEEKSWLQAAYMLGADELVLVETTRVRLPRQQSIDGKPKDRPPLHFTSVSIRSIDLKTGKGQWNASAAFPPADIETEGIFVSLACHALATVWGFRPAGYYEVSSSDMCEVDTPDPYSPSSEGHEQVG